MGLGARAIFGLLALVAAGTALFYADRVFFDLPVYVAAEAGHLISALYRPALDARPELFPDLAQRREPAFDLIVRAVTYVTQNLVQWLRVGGGLAYLAGLACVFLSVRRSLDRRHALAFALLALAYPYYRFAFAVLPAGWTAGLIGLSVLATARIYFSRPVAHAAAVGVIAGGLAMMGPHGLPLGAAFLLLAVADLLLGRRDAKIFVGRVVVFSVALLAAANLVQLAANQPLDAPFSGFLDPRYLKLAGGLGPQAATAGGHALVVMTTAALMLAGVPALTGLLRIELRWRWTRKRGRFHLEPLEAAFLLLALTLVGTLAAVTLLAIADGADAARVWGRQFEFFAPMLWLAAAPFLGEFERGGGRWWRLAMMLTTLIGLGGFTACILTGAQARAWDAAALNAFAREPDAVLPIAVAIVALAAGAILAPRWRLSTVWIACFVALGVASSAVDAWQRDRETPSRNALATETAAADALVSGRQGAVGVVAADPARAKLIYWRLRARPHVVVAGAPSAGQLASCDTVVAHKLDRLGPGWRVLLRGREITVFARDGATTPRLRPQAAGGGGLLSEPGSG